VRKGEICGSDEVYKGHNSLNNLSALEGDKSEKVAKTNVWVEIKRKGKYLQGLEDHFKERQKGNVGSSNKD